MRRSTDAGIVSGPDRRRRCWWCGADPEYVRYHDEEWGVPVANDARLYEKMCLEGFQSGLSWLTILRKRDNFRAAFARFDPRRVAAFGARDVRRLLADAGIVRHRGKIESTINNARRVCAVQGELGSLAELLWRFEPLAADRPDRIDRPVLMSMAKTPASTAMSRELKRRGFSFVGPTTMYALMQSVGMVNDHVVGCGARRRVEAARRAFSRPG